MSEPLIRLSDFQPFSVDIGRRKGLHSFLSGKPINIVVPGAQNREIRGCEPVSIVMVAFNEAQTIEAEVLRFHQVIVERLPGSEFIVAEDGSRDDTPKILQDLVRRIGIIHLTDTERKGYKRALLDAVLSARNPYIFFSDSGGKHDPEEFWKLYPLRDSFDLVVGRKTGRQDQLYRQLLTWTYNFAIRAYFGFNEIRDADSGFRLFNRAVVDRVLRQKLISKNLIASEIVLRTIAAGLKYGEVEVSYNMREGVSRGLPPKNIPSIAIGALRSMAALRSEFRSTGVERQGI